MGILGFVRDVVRRRGRQAWRAFPVLVIVAVAIAPPLVALALEEGLDEGSFLVGGLAVQIAGFSTVWWQIRNALQSHGRPGLWTRFGAWLRSGSRLPTIHARGASASASATASGRARVRTGKGNHSHHARLAALEANFANLESEIDGFRREVDRDKQETREQIAKETQSRTSDVSELRKRLEETAVGSADWQFVGLLWFVAGSVSSTMAKQLAGWF